MIGSYEEWLAKAPVEFTGDPLWRMEAYRLALFAADLAWHDVCKLAQDKRTLEVADQLFRAIGSVHANISEGTAANPARIRRGSTSTRSVQVGRPADGTGRDVTCSQKQCLCIASSS